MIDLDPDEYDMDGVSDRVKVSAKNFEIVGKHEQRKAILSLLENNEVRLEEERTEGWKEGCPVPYLSGRLEQSDSNYDIQTSICDISNIVHLSSRKQPSDRRFAPRRQAVQCHN